MHTPRCAYAPRVRTCDWGGERGTTPTKMRQPGTRVHQWRGDRGKRHKKIHTVRRTHAPQGTGQGKQTTKTDTPRCTYTPWVRTCGWDGERGTTPTTMETRRCTYAPGEGHRGKRHNKDTHSQAHVRTPRDGTGETDYKNARPGAITHLGRGTGTTEMDTPRSTCGSAGDDANKDGHNQAHIRTQGRGTGERDTTKMHIPRPTYTHRVHTNTGGGKKPRR